MAQQKQQTQPPVPALCAGTTPAGRRLEAFEAGRVFRQVRAAACSSTRTRNMSGRTFAPSALSSVPKRQGCLAQRSLALMRDSAIF